VHPFYIASVREFKAAGRPVVGSGPVGLDGTAAWLAAIGKAAGISPEKIDAAKARALPAIAAALESNRIKARITVSGYEGSELLVARTLIESGAEVPYVGTACPRTEWSDPDREWLQARGVHVQYRASLEQDVAAMRDVKPDLAVGTTPLVQKAKELGIPAIYFTNMVSARPLFGAPGISALASIVATQTKGAERFGRMVSFFDKVGTGDATGYGWQGTPEAHPGAKERFRKMREAKAKAAANQAMGS
jgi:chlorophyllide a reductase subunit Y